MIKFSQEKVLLLHQQITQETGGDPGLRDIGLLDSALESAYATVDGIDLYPSKAEKAARIGFSLISNHAFVDGNKRIGMYIMLTFLEVNGLKARPTNAEVVRVGLAVAAGSMKYEELLSWVRKSPGSNDKVFIIIKTKGLAACDAQAASPFLFYES